MIQEIDTYKELVRVGIDSWKEAKMRLSTVEIDWSSPHPAIETRLDELDAGLTTAYELAGSINDELPVGVQGMLLVSPGFKSLLDALTKLRDVSNAIKDYFKIAEDAGHKVTVLDVNRLNDEAGRQFDIATHLKQIKANAGNFVSQLASLRDFLIGGGIGDLSKRIDAFHSLSDDIKSIHDRVKKASRDAEGSLKNVQEVQKNSHATFESIEKIQKAATDVQANSAAALTEINTKLVNIRETTTQAENLAALVDKYQAKYSAFDTELDKRLALFTQFEEANKAAQEQNQLREKEIDRLVREANQMLQGATNAGLAKAFNDASVKYGNEADDAKKGFYWSIMFLVSTVLPLASYIFPIPYLDTVSDSTSNGVTLGGVLSRIVFLLPGVWLTSFTALRYSSLFQLHREYSFKAAIAMSVDGFKMQAPEYKEAIAGSAFIELATKPDYAPHKDTAKSPNPILGYLVHMLQKRFEKMSGGSDKK
jgi:hypothetical protein